MFNLFFVKDLFNLSFVENLFNLFFEKDLQDLLNLFLTKFFVSILDSNIQKQTIDYKNKNISNIFKRSNLLKL